MAGDFRAKTIPLSKTTKFIVDNRGRSAPTADHGIPLIATNCISNNQLYPAYEKLRFVTKETYGNWFRSHPLPGDIILTTKGSQNGAICLVPDPVDFVIAQDMVALRANEKIIDPLYLFAALRSANVQQEIKNLDVSGVIPHFKKTDFDKLQLPYPERNVQEIIGRIYYDFCAKIEFNRRMNATLEAMARALFQSWFVDFDPVRAKLDGRQPVELDPGTAGLFPAAFKDSSLGPIPDGWSVIALGEIADFEKGLSYKGEGLAENGGMPMVNLGCFAGRGLFNANRLKRYTGEYRQRHLVRAGDLVVANTDMTQSRVVIGSPALVPELNGAKEFLFTHHVFAARFKPGAEIWRRYIFFTLLQPEFREIAEGFSTGTTVLALPRDGLANYTLCIPPVSLLDAFERLVSPILSTVDANLHQSGTLATLRDTLLPKLLGGDIRPSSV
ncbi:MAG: restriction endonuclease subunit S [Cyanobacteriota bacterium]|jgi:type I restriction enzyme S subunit